MMKSFLHISAIGGRKAGWFEVPHWLQVFVEIGLNSGDIGAGGSGDAYAAAPEVQDLVGVMMMMMSNG